MVDLADHVEADRIVGGEHEGEPDAVQEQPGSSA